VSAERPCANCGEPVDPKQLVCLECGARVALKEHRSWASEPMAPLAAGLVVLIVIGAGLFGFAISELTSGGGDDSEPAATIAQTATTQEGPAVVDGEGQRTESSDAPARTETAETTTLPYDDLVNRVPQWPPDLSAHTVVLLTTGDRPSAANVAREARKAGLEAGMLRSDPYDLGSGLWIVYTGQFDSRSAAARQAAGLQGRYPGAYPQLVQRSQ
jgi:hypothetical protein